MTPLHPPITEFTLAAINRYLQEQVPLLIDQRLQQTLPAWAEQSLSQPVHGSETSWRPEYSRWLDERLAQYWVKSLEPKIQEVVSATLDQLLEPLLTQLTEVLTPQLETMVRGVLAQAATQR